MKHDAPDHGETAKERKARAALQRSYIQEAITKIEAAVRRRRLSWARVETMLESATTRGGLEGVAKHERTRAKKRVSLASDLLKRFERDAENLARTGRRLSKHWETETVRAHQEYGERLRSLLDFAKAALRFAEMGVLQTQGRLPVSQQDPEIDGLRARLLEDRAKGLAQFREYSLAASRGRIVDAKSGQVVHSKHDFIGGRALKELERSAGVSGIEFAYLVAVYTQLGRLPHRGPRLEEDLRLVLPLPFRDKDYRRLRDKVSYSMGTRPKKQRRMKKT